jgi:hypothetical protein
LKKEEKYMNVYNLSRLVITLLSFSLLDFACSAHSNPPSGALPQSWVNLHDDKNNKSVDNFVMPDASADAAVQSAFKANVSALSQATDAQAANSTLPVSVNSHPSDWTPWHLDGMVGYYAISQGGILGALLYSGTESIKLTWQKVAPPAVVPAAASPSAPVVTTTAIPELPATLTSATASSSTQSLKTPALKVTPQMTASDLPAALEPSIQVALASGKIQNESVFRTNLLSHAQRFFSVAQVLSSIPRASEWYVDGYQLNLSVSASGQVTPLIGVGGAVSLYFDWSRSTDPTAAATLTDTNAPSPDGNLLTNELKNFVSLMSSEIPQAITESMSVQKNGFYLDMIQIGLGVTAGGSIGVAQATGGDIGRVIFKRDVTVSAPSTPISVESTQELNVMPALASSAPAGFSYRINARKVRNSLKKAISMANYFAARAKNAETARYHLNQIEAEFDMSLGGDLKLAVVNGIGQFVLDFDWIKQN